MPLITVITPTVRPDAIELVIRALKEQTFKDFQWIISTPEVSRVVTEGFGWEMSAIAEWTLLGDDEIGNGGVLILEDPPKPKGAFWTLNRAYNKMIGKARGDLIVSWQDATYAEPDALAKFAYYFKNGYDNFLVSGTGHKYKDETWKEVVWQDPRRRLDGRTFYPCVWTDVEWNFCSVPKKAVYVVGGFDEKMDELGFGMDGLSVNERVYDLGGYDFALDQTNESFSIPHGRLKGWDENNLHGAGYTARKGELKDIGVWPTLSYLKS